MSLADIFRKKQKPGPEDSMVKRRLSKLPPPPSHLTRPVLQYDTQRAMLGYGPEPFTRAVNNLARWQHEMGYTYKDINDYLVYVLGVKYGARPRI